MIRATTFVLGLLALLALPAAAQDAGPVAPAPASPVQIVSDFYTAALALDQGGIPNAKARRRLAPYVSADLERLLAQGAEAEAAYAATTKGQAPALLEGDIFTSLFEGATSFRAGDCEVEGTKANCRVALSYDRVGEKPQHWNDTAVLVQTPQGWRVDDIDYQGNWPFANTGTLKQNLAFAIHNASGTGG